MSKAEDIITELGHAKLRHRIESGSAPVPECGCWLWLGSGDKNGYGSIGTGRRSRSAKVHRVSFIVFVGPIPNGYDVLHKCDTPCCVNPDHLMLGTAQSNLVDMVIKKRSTANRGNLPYGVRKQHRRYKRPDTPDRFEAVVVQGGRTVYLGTFATIDKASVIATNARAKWLRGIG